MVDGIPDSDLESIFIVNALASLFSIIGCIFIIAMYILFQDLRKLAFQLIMILSVFDLLNAVSFMIPTYNSVITDTVCLIQGVLMNFSTFAAVLWTSFIAITLYVIVVKSYLNISQLMKRYLIFNLFSACIFAVLPNFVQNDSSEGYCWLYRGGSQRRYMFRLFTFMVPLWCIIFVNIFLYVIVFRNLRGSEGGEVAEMRRKLSVKIGIYPIIIVVCYLPYSVKSVLEVQSSLGLEGYEYNFTLFAGMIRCLIGLFNAIAYGLTKNVRKVIRKKMCCRNKELMRSTLMAEYIK